ncbi:MAG: helix-turn-helix domain-containing protein [Clostridia bacterium]|nr:helix-turn-helix domain-containing protein [Clostridia bacterium]MBQ4158815.1 helix-turn-helix domain-containing protein [Clostridia bacterium]
MFDCIIAVNSLEHVEKIRVYLQQGGFPVNVIGALTEGEGLFKIISEFQVDVLIIEADLKNMMGFQALKEALQPQPHCAVVLASEREDFSYEHASQAIEAGVQGYILLPVEEKHLSRAMGSVLKYLYDHNAGNNSLSGAEPIKQEPAEESKSAELAESIYRFIEKNHVQPLQIKDIMNHFHISESYVNRLLMKNFGNSFKKILNRARLEEARKLLREKPNLPINEIAISVGYQDVYYFYRLYKATMGVTPSADRENGGE